MTSVYSLSEQAVLRPEAQGALWFMRPTAELLDLDLEGLQTLHIAVSQPHKLSLRGRIFIHYLHCRGFLRRHKAPKGKSTHQTSIAALEVCLEQAKTLKTPLRSLSAPEALHISLTDRCDQRCAGCFFSNPGIQTPNRFLSLQHFAQIANQAAANRVFQLALGGGEPLLHPQLLEMVQLASGLGLVVSLTSNGNALTPTLALALKAAGLGQFQLSLNGFEAKTHAQTRPNHSQVLAAIETCQATALRWGLNVLVTRQNLHELEKILTFAQAEKAHSLNLLRPKPALQGGKWLDHSLTTAQENRQLQVLIQRWQRKARFLLTTDSSFAFLRQGRLKQWQAAGITGCSAGRQILSVGVDGRVSPCSHVPLFDSCDDGDFMQVWQRSEHLSRFRQLEETLMGECQSCELKSVCRGCRAIVLKQSGNFDGVDSGCPKHQPILS